MADLDSPDGTDISTFGWLDNDPFNHHNGGGSGSGRFANNLNRASQQFPRPPQLDAAQFMQQFERTMAHGEAVIKSRKAPYEMASTIGLAPVWTSHKEWLCEALDYVGRHVGKKRKNGRALCRGETLSGEVLDGGLLVGGGEEADKGEVVVSVVLGPGGEDEEDPAEDFVGIYGVTEDPVERELRMKRTWIDGEVVICEAAAGVRAKSERTRVWNAWDQTWRKNTSVVVIVGRGWGDAEDVVPWPSDQANWVVLDHFRVAEFWVEQRPKYGRSQAVAMVKLQRIGLETQSWWSCGRRGAPAALPLEQRQFIGDEWEKNLRTACNACNGKTPTIYQECWICMNYECRNFWREGLRIGADGQMEAVDVPKKLRFNGDFLMERTGFDKVSRPSWELAPNLIDALTAWKNAITVMGTVKMSLLWRGMVCLKCRAIVPTSQWCLWMCQNPECQRTSNSSWYFDFDIGQMPLEAIVPRSFVSWKGHPLIGPKWPDVLGGSVRRVYRPTYMVDIISGQDWTLKILSPTADFNTQVNGPDQLFHRLLLAANQLENGLGLTRSNRHPCLDDHFHQTFGVEYGVTMGFRRASNAKAKAIDASPDVSIAQALLDNVCSDEQAGLRPDPSNSVQVHGYMEGMGLAWHIDGNGDLGNTIATLSLGGDAELIIRSRGDTDSDLEADDVLDIVDEQNRIAARARVPLIHGSIVMMYDSFDKHFEHKVECRGPLRFAVTTRYVDRESRAKIVMDEEEVENRFNGQKFFESDDESEDEEELPEAAPSRTSESTRPVAHASINKRARAHDFTYDAPAARRRRRSQSSTEYKSAGWTQNQKNQILDWKERDKMQYGQIARRAEVVFKCGKVNPRNLRMVVKREKEARQKRRELFPDADDASSVAPSDSASATPRVAFEGEQIGDPKAWSQLEIDRLLEYRSRPRPLTYKEIRQLENNKRSEKAYREQVTTQNKKRRWGGTTETAQRAMPSRAARVEDEVEDVAMTEPQPVSGIFENAPASPPQSPVTRGTRASRSRVVEPPANATPRGSRAGRGSRAAPLGVPGTIQEESMEGIEGPAARTRTRSRA